MFVAEGDTMQSNLVNRTVYQNNRADGNAIAVYGDVHGDLHLPGPPDAKQWLRDLKVTDPRDDKIRIQQGKDQLLKKCYSWILDDPNFQRWRMDPDSRLLWIKGDPGKGKTMMMMGLIDELSRDDNSKSSSTRRPKFLSKIGLGSKLPLISYFFCQSTRPELSNATSVLRGLIYMLVVQKEELAAHFEKRYKEAGESLLKGHNALYALTDILGSMLNDTSLPRTYVLIDALDECSSGLKQLLQIISDGNFARRSRVKWLVTSRNLPHIDRYLSPETSGAKISLELNSQHIFHAVAAYIHFKLDQLAATQGSRDFPGRREVQQTLSQKAEGTFLWVSLVCKELENVPLYRIQTVLRELPPGLDPLYDRMMGHIQSQSDPEAVLFCLNVLRSVVLAYRPLKPKELAVSAGLPVGLFSTTSQIHDLVNRCGSFLVIRNNSVFFLHLSAKDYFIFSKGREIFDGNIFKEQEMLLYRMLSAMHDFLKQDMCGLRDLGARIDKATGRTENSPLPQIAYACEYWVDHLAACFEKCEDMLSDSGEIHYFFQTRFLQWLEAMSLLRKMPITVRMLQNLHSMINESKSPALSAMVHDAIRFTMWCQIGIEQAPLQVYSALFFAPQKSLIRKHFAQLMPKGVHSKSVLREDWGPLLHTLETDDSSDWVWSVAFSPNTRMIATGAISGTVRLCDARAGSLLQVLHNHSTQVRAVVFSPNNELIVSSSQSGSVKICNASTGKPLRNIRAHSGAVWDLAFSPDGNVLVSASDDTTIGFWDPRTGNLRKSMRDHSGPVKAVRFSSDGKYLATGSQDETVKLWEVATGTVLKTFKGHRDTVQEVGFSPSGHVLTSCSIDGQVKLWDIKNLRWLDTIKVNSNSVWSAEFSPNGKILAVGCVDGQIELWDASSRTLLQTLVNHTHSVYSLSFSSDSKLLVSGALDGTANLWDLGTEDIFEALGNPSRAVDETDSFRMSSFQSEYLLKNFGDDLEVVHYVAFSCDGKILASKSADGKIKLREISTGSVSKTLHGSMDKDKHSSESRLAFSPDRSILAEASANAVRLWDISRGKVLRTLKNSSVDIRRFVFLTDGETLATESLDRTAVLWNIRTGALLRSIQPDIKTPDIVALSITGILAWTSYSNNVALYDFVGKVMHELKHSEEVTSLEFFSHGRVLASCSTHGTITLWDTETRQRLQSVPNHHKRFGKRVFSNNGGIVATISRDDTITIHATWTGAHLQTLKGHASEILGVAFSPDDQVLVSWSYDETIKLWNVGTELHAANISALRTEDTIDDGKPYVTPLVDREGKQQSDEGQDSSTLRDEHSGEIHCSFFSESGQVVLSCSEDSTIKIWEPLNHELLRTLRGHSASVRDMEVSPDGRLIASASDDTTVRLWRFQTGEILHILEPNSGGVNRVCFSPNGEFLAAATDNSSIFLWDPRKAKLRRTMKSSSEMVWNLKFSCDGKLLASSALLKPDVTIWNPFTGRVVYTLKGHSATVYDLTFSPLGRHLATGSADNTVKLWDLHTGLLLHTLEGHAEPLGCVAFTPNGTVLASSSEDKSVKLWDVKTGAELEEIDCKVYIGDFKFNAGGDILETDCGNLYPASVASTRYPQPPIHKPSVFLSGQWITYGGKDMLWLPPEWRISDCSDVFGDTIAMGFPKGRMVFLHFTFPN